MYMNTKYITLATFHKGKRSKRTRQTRYFEKVDRYWELGRPSGLPSKQFKASLALFHTMTAAAAASSYSPIDTEENNRRKNLRKLTRVVSTKLSVGDDDFLQQLTAIAYQDGSIKVPTKSELVRFILTLALSSIRKEQARLSLVTQ